MRTKENYPVSGFVLSAVLPFGLIAFFTISFMCWYPYFFRIWLQQCNFTLRAWLRLCSFTRFLSARLLSVSAGLFRSVSFGGLKACRPIKNFVSRWVNPLSRALTGIKHNFRLFFLTFYYIWRLYPVRIAFPWALNAYWMFVNFLHLSCLFLFSCLIFRRFFRETAAR